MKNIFFTSILFTSISLGAFAQNNNDVAVVLRTRASIAASLNEMGSNELYNKAMEYKASDNLTEASKLLKKALEKEAENTTYKLELADVQYNRKQFFEAIPLYEEMLLKENNNVTILSRLAEMYSMSPNKMKGIEYADKVMKLKPTDATVLKMLARSYMEVQNFPKAVKLYVEVEKQLKDDKDIPFKIGKCYQKISDFGNAVPWFKRAVELDPTNATKIYEAGNSCYDANQFTEAIRLYQLAEDKGFYKSKTFYDNWAMSCEAMKDYDQALFYYSKAKEFAPYDKTLTLSMSDVYVKKGNFERSREILEGLLEINPKDAEVIYSIGMTYYKQANTGKAEKYFNQAFELDPSLKSLRYSKSNF